MKMPMPNSSRITWPSTERAKRDEWQKTVYKVFMESAGLARAHWNERPLFLSQEERYRIYPWLYEAAEFCHHRGERVLEVGCGTGVDLLQFARNGAIATGVDITDEHLRLARERV